MRREEKKREDEDEMMNNGVNNGKWQIPNGCVGIGSCLSLTVWVPHLQPFVTQQDRPAREE